MCGLRANALVTRTNSYLFSFEKRRVHDLRGTARTRMGKMNIPDNIAQRCLNQIPGNRTDGIYNKDAYFEERKVAHKMRSAWI